MKRCLLFFAMVIPMFVIGCGGDDEVVNPPTPPQTTKVTAAEPATSPAAVDAAAWDDITATAVAIPAAGIKFKRSADAEPASTASTVSVKAAVYSDTLFMWVKWADNSFSARPNAWRVDSVLVGGTPQFEHMTVWAQDQLALHFSGLTDSGWDVWHWQVHSTSYAMSADTLLSGYAEGKTLRDRILTTHAGDRAMVGANDSLNHLARPTYVHSDSMLCPGIFLTADKAKDSASLTSPLWVKNGYVPGYITDTSLATASAVDRNSRWSVNAKAQYEGGMYTVLLSRALTTSHTDDLNFAAGDSVTTRIGISNNFDFTYSATEGSTEQGFTGSFILILP